MRSPARLPRRSPSNWSRPTRYARGVTESAKRYSVTATLGSHSTRRRPLQTHTTMASTSPNPCRGRHDRPPPPAEPPHVRAVLPRARRLALVSVGRFPDDALAEIFINGKCGSDSDTAARDSAVVASIALQYGVPLETIRRALMRNRDGSACGPLSAALDREQLPEDVS